MNRVRAISAVLIFPMLQGEGVCGGITGDPPRKPAIPRMLPTIRQKG